MEEAQTPTVLIPTTAYLPGTKAGGPIRSLANLVERLGDEFRFLIATLDHDWCERAPYPGIQTGVWTRLGKAAVCYLSERDVQWGRLHRFLKSTPADVLYFNGVFDPVMSFRPYVLRFLAGQDASSLVIAPRGELLPAALATKRWKKKPYLFLLRSLGVLRRCTWHATNEREKEAILNVFGPQECFVANNLPAAARPAAARAKPKQAGALRLAFVGRVHPIKNLDFAIARLKPLAGNIVLSIYGLLEDSQYWARCEALIATLPPLVRVNCRGVLPYEALADELPQHDALFLPTQTENYGHAIIESLAAGLPVVISNRTPWRQLESARVGWDIPLEDPNRFTSVLQHLADLDEQGLQPFRERAVQYANSARLDPAVLGVYRQMFRRAAAKGKPG
jgi:glycosyltransferase involved in cell wall biosynthesis